MGTNYRKIKKTWRQRLELLINKSKKIRQLLLDDESDDEFRDDLKKVLKKMGAKFVKRDYAVVGSQELQTYIFSLHGEEIILESETYIGLSIIGPRNIIWMIIEELNTLYS